MKEIFNTIFNAGKTKEAPKEKEHKENGDGTEQKESEKDAHQKGGNGQEQKAAGV